MGLGMMILDLVSPVLEFIAPMAPGEFFPYFFTMEMFQRALIAAILVTMVAGVLGSFLLIRNLALIGDGLAPNGEAFGSGISFPTTQIEGDYFLRVDMFPNRLFRYDGRRWVKMEDNVRMTLSNTDTKNTQRTGFINNTQESTIGGDTVKERQGLSQALKAKADN